MQRLHCAVKDRLLRPLWGFIQFASVLECRCGHGHDLSYILRAYGRDFIRMKELRDVHLRGCFRVKLNRIRLFLRHEIHSVVRQLLPERVKLFPS